MTKPKMFIFLHGYNSIGDEMKILDKSFKEIAPKGSVFLYPNAPFKVNNSNKYCWFPVVLGDNPDVINEDFVYESMQQSVPYLVNYIQQNFEKYNMFSYEDIILVGFSQGSIFAIHSALHFSNKICCVVSFSGGFAKPSNSFQINKKNKTPILLIHGVNDQILPYNLSVRAEIDLREIGCDVEAHFLDQTKHIITPSGIKIAKNFINSNL